MSVHSWKQPDSHGCSRTSPGPRQQPASPGMPPAGDERAQALESVAERWLASAPGMRPSIAAALLGLSEPTVRAWARRGILRIRSRNPRLLLDPASVLEVRQLVGELRLAGRTRDLLDEVYNHFSVEQ